MFIAMNRFKVIDRDPSTVAASMANRQGANWREAGSGSSHMPFQGTPPSARNHVALVLAHAMVLYADCEAWTKAEQFFSQGDESAPRPPPAEKAALYRQSEFEGSIVIQEEKPDGPPPVRVIGRSNVRVPLQSEKQEAKQA